MFGQELTEDVKFVQVPQEDCESFLSEAKSSSHLPIYRHSYVQWIYIPLLFLTSIAASTLLGTWIGSSWNHPSTLLYSPLMKDIDITYGMVTYNGSLMHENIYRQGAGPEVDAAWEALGVDYRPAIVPTNLAASSGLLPSQVQVNEKYGGGYPANVEGLHHLHCLNLLRKSLYYNYDHYHTLGLGAFKNDDQILRFHVSHCLDILRQQLMCTVDVSVLGQVWWKPEEPQAYPDFNTRHMCRNFEEVRMWAEENQAPLDVPRDYLKVPAKEDVLEKMP